MKSCCTIVSVLPAGMVICGLRSLTSGGGMMTTRTVSEKPVVPHGVMARTR